MDKESVLHYRKETAMPSLNIAASLFRKGGNIPEIFPQDLDRLKDIESKYPEMKAMNHKDKIAFIEKKRLSLLKELSKDGRQVRLDKLRKQVSKLDSLVEWMDSNLQLQKPDNCSFRKLRRAVAEGSTIYMDRNVEAEVPASDFEKEVFRLAEILMIEHDWASAFEKANVQDAAIKLPYDVCAFEFKFSGRAVIALATQFETDIAYSPAIECDDGTWVLFGSVGSSRGYAGNDTDNSSELMNLIAAQIRCACIALDAEVARSEVMREPYNGTRGKNNHQLSKPYHVVSLAHRSARPLPASGTETSRRVRLHFRRGHWRHFDNHKTWIKWMLVGDPDLGFVDKHYRL